MKCVNICLQHTKNTTWHKHPEQNSADMHTLVCSGLRFYLQTTKYITLPSIAYT
jgi:hypothetical protein